MDGDTGSSSSGGSNGKTPLRTEPSGEAEPLLPPAPAGMERDSAAAEDVADLPALLLPPGFAPLASLDSSVMDRFGLCYSRAALRGWVKQPSPCCAAASTAGAWNCVMGLHRSDPRSARSFLMGREIFKGFTLRLEPQRGRRDGRGGFASSPVGVER